MNISYRSHSFHSAGRSHRSCRSHIQIIQLPADHTLIQITQIKIPLRYKGVKYLLYSDPIPAKHDVNKCEVSRFYRSLRSWRNPASSPSGTHVWNIYLIKTPSRLNMLKTSVKYPDFTDPPHLTEILQIIQILQFVQTASRIRCTDRTDHTDATQVDHTDPTDHKHATYHTDSTR